MMKTPCLSTKIIYLLMLFLLIPGSGIPVWGQADSREVQDLLDRFDGRLSEVRSLVDASRDPEANRLLKSAVTLRGQAESELRAQHFERALNLATRALEMLDKAQRQAQSGTGSVTVDKLNRTLDSYQQQSVDSRRRLDDEESNSNKNTQIGADRTFLQRQTHATLALVEKAELSAKGTPQTRDDELAVRARQLFNQASALLPADQVAPVGPDERYRENRLREARTLLDQADQEMNQIDQELARLQRRSKAAEPGSVESRLRNAGRQINRANDLIDLAETGGAEAGMGGTNTVLGLLRRASELARQALRAGENSQVASEEWIRRNETVGSLIEQIEKILEPAVTPPPDYFAALDLREQAVTAAGKQQYDQALRLLGDSASRLNRVLALLGANRSPASRLEVFKQLRDQFEKRYLEVAGQQPGTSNQCDGLLQNARNQAKNADAYVQANNLDGALFAINQAQKILEEAAQCLGMNTSKVHGLLDRLQGEYDRRKTELDANLPTSPNPAGLAVLNDSLRLRDLSDTQESQGQYETAVQTVGRALSTMGTAFRLLYDKVGEEELDLLNNLQSQFDARLSKVTEIVQNSANQMAKQLLLEAQNLRRQSEQGETSNRIGMGLNQVGLAIQGLEKATLLALGR
jgi:tetratricopeptide (TPR) repeat protein